MKFEATKEFMNESRTEAAKADPSPLQSHLPATLDTLQVHLLKDYVPEDDLVTLKNFQRVCNYIAAAMIFLCDNVLLENKLTSDHIKPRLLGHWGTCPALALAYSHCNRIISKYNLDMLFVTGPGHGAPAILAALYIEGSLQAYYPQYGHNMQGLHRLITKFSVTGGFPSHVNAEVPGAIHEGGELGYALSVSYGAVLDRPNLIVACVVGDGEAETGPTAASWHCHKFIDPAESGAVIPILNLNGFKISERTVYGCMDRRELSALFSGFGYQVVFVDYRTADDVNRDMAAAMDWCVEIIHEIQDAARAGTPIIKPRWPMIILHTPKGWGCPKTLHGKPLEGTFRAHQVPLKNAKTDAEELGQLENWLKSYHIEDFIDKSNGLPLKGLIEHLPPRVKRMGQKTDANNDFQPLCVPDWNDFSIDRGILESATSIVGKYLDRVLQANPKTLRLFSPDELASNKLDGVLEHSNRTLQTDAISAWSRGRVTEVLSEHMCQGFMQGYTLTGRTAIFPSYEAFLPIITSMTVQYTKFLKMALETKWHGRVGSLNYVTTSTWARQEHNGFSHQSPRFITTMLSFKPTLTRVYFPPDTNCFLSTIAHCLSSDNGVNLMVSSKNPGPSWLSREEAEEHCVAGASVWKFASTDGGLDPDVVLVGIGNEIMFEVIAAASILAHDLPKLRIRVVNITDLMILADNHPHSMSEIEFNALFTPNRHVHFNYHGYVMDLQSLLFSRIDASRVSMEGYCEEGTTTTPFNMMIANRTSRYHVAMAAVAGATCNPEVAMNCHKLISNYKHRLTQIKHYIYENGVDPEGTFDIPDNLTKGQVI
ncbi:phosphoketolase [Schizosaccharomyces japonicus yFS275]|uniref:Phosphoketolase n=1 Tax=Schizosaccharomyces japonicus (strain yFS275 / FY16936) TaxID=402676 RepID=B6K1W7_SCHJY|nr:phosphoketolase [Schizosaccharomyces japonicus yFS275]EEB07148.1 phosphoketolase [Schizosaccharomyces japonicus yFS275]